MSKKSFLHYWDACIFINVIQGNEPDKGNILKTHVKDVVAGRIRIVTSSFTLAEVVKPKHSKIRLSKTDEIKIKGAFAKNILLYELTRKIAEKARELQWEIGVKPADSIHLATAEFAGVYYFATYDDRLIKKVKNAPSGIWNHKFDIGHPQIVNYELNMSDD